MPHIPSLTVISAGIPILQIKRRAGFTPDACDRNQLQNNIVAVQNFLNALQLVAVAPIKQRSDGSQCDERGHTGSSKPIVLLINGA